MMLPPPLIRRLVLAPLVVVIAVGMVVLFPVLAVVTGVFGLAARFARHGRMMPVCWPIWHWPPKQAGVMTRLSWRAVARSW